MIHIPSKTRFSYNFFQLLKWFINLNFITQLEFSHFFYNYLNFTPSYTDMSIFLYTDISIDILIKITFGQLIE